MYNPNNQYYIKIIIIWSTKLIYTTQSSLAGMLEENIKYGNNIN